VRADVTGASLVEFAKEFARLRAGDITDAEVGKARETLRNDVVNGFVGNEGLIGAAAELIEAGLPLGSLAADMRAMGDATGVTLNDTAKTAVRLDEGVLVLVGDKGTILPQLEGLGLPEPVEYTAEGEPASK
jgi:predicted Zn-dependent peptidase